MIVLYNDVHDISIFFKGTGKFILMTILKKLVPWLRGKEQQGAACIKV